MKKNYIITLLLTLLFSSTAFCQDLLITGIIDGPLPGGSPKGLELYAVNDIPDLSIYGLESTTNGADASGVEYTFPNDGIDAGTFIYIAHNSASSDGFQQYLGVTPQYINGVINVNGDDTVILYKNEVIEDVIGVIGEDGSGKVWDHLDGWAYRKSGSEPSATFDASQWVFSGANALDGCDLSDDTGTNAMCDSVFPTGSYSTEASTAPAITVSNAITSLNYFEGNGPSSEREITISGENLTTDIAITAPADFEVSLTSGSDFASSLTVTPVSGAVASTTVYVRLVSGLSVNTYSGVVTVSSAGADEKTIAVSGDVAPADAQFFFSAFLDPFTYISGNGPSTVQDFEVEGLFLTGDLIVTVPQDFEISLSSDTAFSSSVSITPNSGTLEETDVFIRLKSGLSEGDYSGDVTLTSNGVEEKTFALEGRVFGELSNSLIITGVYDGPRSGGTPKGVELYVLKDISDLSVFGVSSVANGAGTTFPNVEFSFPEEAATAGTFIYVATNETGFNDFFGFNPTYTTGSVAINGDDSIELYENGQIIDVFGDVDTDGTNTDWDYLDGWAYRNSNSQPAGTDFNLSEWTFSDVNGLEVEGEGEATNETVASKFPIGTFTGTLSTINNTIDGFATYPNPVTNNEITVKSNSLNRKDISIFNLLGKQVLNTSFLGVKSNINVSSIASGLYILKVIEGKKVATLKLMIK